MLLCMDFCPVDFIIRIRTRHNKNLCLFNGRAVLSMCPRHIQDPASQRLTWNKPPVNVLVIRKIRDESLVEPFKELCRFLVEVQNLIFASLICRTMWWIYICCFLYL